jgi:hypothetical protein
MCMLALQKYTLNHRIIRTSTLCFVKLRRLDYLISYASYFTGLYYNEKHLVCEIAVCIANRLTDIASRSTTTQNPSIFFRCYLVKHVQTGVKDNIILHLFIK